MSNNIDINNQTPRQHHFLSLWLNFAVKYFIADVNYTVLPKKNTNSFIIALLPILLVFIAIFFTLFFCAFAETTITSRTPALKFTEKSKGTHDYISLCSLTSA